MKTTLCAVMLLMAGLVLPGCAARTATDAADPVTDPVYLTADLWDDGQAEVAFYQVDRTRNQYGRPVDQQFMAGTYLVKHDFDPEAMAKAAADAARRVPGFKYALFYEFESGSYQYKRHYVVNAAQADLAPLKASFTSFDWCSNLYRELAFHTGGTVDALLRSDDYGNEDRSFAYRPGAYPVHLLPVLVRALDFAETDEQAFSVVLLDGSYVSARARRDGAETLDLPGGPAEAERIVVTYDAPVPSLIGEQSDAAETYWRGTGPDRLLLRLEGETGRYRMTLVEHLRTPYWSENLWPRLERVTARP